MNRQIEENTDRLTNCEMAEKELKTIFRNFFFNKASFHAVSLSFQTQELRVNDINRYKLISQFTGPTKKNIRFLFFFSGPSTT